MNTVKCKAIKSGLRKEDLEKWLKDKSSVKPIKYECGGKVRIVGEFIDGDGDLRQLQQCVECFNIELV